MALIAWVAAACSPTVDVAGRGAPAPSPGEAAAADEEAIVRTMRYWLEEFRSKQREYFEQTDHYAEDVTVGGAVQPLRPPYETDYWVSQSLKGYEVVVRHRTSRRSCRLGDGRFAHPADAGEIICGP